jgi:hypothetical protein
MTVATLKERRIAPIRLKETTGTALPAGMNVFHVLSTLAANVERGPGDERRETAFLAPRGHGMRPGRKSLDLVKARATLQVMAAGLTRSTARSVASAGGAAAGLPTA